MITIVFENNVEGVYEETVKYFYRAIIDHCASNKGEKFVLDTFTKEVFDTELEHDKRAVSTCSFLDKNNTELGKQIGRVCCVFPNGKHITHFSTTAYFLSVEPENRLTVLKQWEEKFLVKKQNMDYKPYEWILLCDATDCLRYMIERGYTFERPCEWASWYGAFNCLRLLHSSGYELTRDVLYDAAKNGHLDCLKYAHENGCEMCSSKIAANSIECLRYVIEHGGKWDKDTCTEAATYTNLECLKYAHENGCGWSSRTCAVVVTYVFRTENDKLECLKYLHENGCEWDAETCKEAAHGGYLECLKYAHEKRMSMG